MSLSRYDRQNVITYIASLIKQPSHFNSNKNYYQHGAAGQYVDVFAAACGEQRGEKGSRLELPDLKPVAEKLLTAVDPITRELATHMLQMVNNELRYYKPKAPTPAKPSSPNDKQAEAPAHSRYNPYAQHAGTGKCPTCRQPLPGSGR